MLHRDREIRRREAAAQSKTTEYFFHRIVLAGLPYTIFVTLLIVYPWGEFRAEFRS